MSHKPTILAATLALALAGCGAPPPASAPPPPLAPPDGIARASLGESVKVDGPRITPLAVLEDSRCPINARCGWAGQVRLSVRIDLGAGSETREITLGKPLPVADGALELVEVLPAPLAGAAEKPKPYRFGFRFAGGL